MGNNKHRLKVIAHIGIDYIYIWVKMRTRMSMYVGTIVAYLYSVVAGDSSPMPPTPLKKKMRMWGTSATVCKWGYSQKGYSLVFSERHASKARIIMVHISHYPLASHEATVYFSHAIWSKQPVIHLFVFLLALYKSFSLCYIFK